MITFLLIVIIFILLIPFIPYLLDRLDDCIYENEKRKRLPTGTPNAKELKKILDTYK